MKLFRPPFRIARYTLFALFCLTLLSFPEKKAWSQNQKPARILFLLDASGSMSQPWSAQTTRFQAASKIIVEIMDSIQAVNPDVAFALRAFGDQYPAKDSNCTDTKLEVAFGYKNESQISTRLQWIFPQGFSPIALSLQQAAENDFTEDDQYAYSIILLTDGGETCGGDICATVHNLLSKKISFTPYIITLVDYKPLKNEYDCLGNVLAVTTPQEIKPAVQRILQDNRKILEVKGIGLHPMVKSSPKPKTVIPVSPSKPIIKEKKKPVVVIKAPEPKPVIKPAEKPKPIETKKPVEQPSTVVKTEPKPSVREIDRIVQVSKLRRANILFALPAPKPIVFPSGNRVFTMTIKNEPIMTPTVSINKTPKPVIRKNNPPANNGPKKVDFYTTTENAQKTTLLVYFTNGKGKFYYTEPLMKLLNATTGKEIKQLYRNVSGTEPDPIDINEGTYDIVIPGSNSEAAHVTIQPNKTNKVYIKAGLASLAFYYTTEPDKPAKEYTAFVSDRFGSRKVTQQPCDQLLPYEPANYHIEINTIPKLVYNIDLNFSELKEVPIPTPGTFQVLNTSPMEKIQLWYQLGNEYVPFLNMNITGSPDAQKVNLLPGFYQVRYFKSPHKPYDVSIIVPFRIKSEQTTSITLSN